MQLTHTQTRSVQPGPLYRVLDTVTSSVDIETEVFVFVVATEVFDRVATPYDLETFANTKAAAISAGQAYYRAASVQKDWASLTDAENFSESVSSRLQTLVTDYSAVVNTFVGATTATLTD